MAGGSSRLRPSHLSKMYFGTAWCLLSNALPISALNFCILSQVRTCTAGTVSQSFTYVSCLDERIRGVCVVFCVWFWVFGLFGLFVFPFLWLSAHLTILSVS